MSGSVEYIQLLVTFQHLHLHFAMHILFTGMPSGGDAFCHADIMFLLLMCTTPAKHSTMGM
jgi:hypothetical protein